MPVEVPKVPVEGLSETQEGLIPDNWGHYLPVPAETNGFYEFEVVSTKPLDIFVVPTYADFDLFMYSKQYQFFSDCTDYAVNTFKKTCFVPNTAGIVLFNYEQTGLGTTKYKVTITQIELS